MKQKNCTVVLTPEFELLVEEEADPPRDGVTLSEHRRVPVELDLEHLHLAAAGRGRHGAAFCVCRS